MDDILTAAMDKESVEMVNEFPLPLQSRALALLLNVPQSEAGEQVKKEKPYEHVNDFTMLVVALRRRSTLNKPKAAWLFFSPIKPFQPGRDLASEDYRRLVPIQLIVFAESGFS